MNCLLSKRNPMPYENYQPIVEVTRGSVVESVHFGALVIADSNGQVLASWGDPQTTTYLRSSAKPFQALPFFEMGGPQVFPAREFRPAGFVCLPGSEIQRSSHSCAPAQNLFRPCRL